MERELKIIGKNLTTERKNDFAEKQREKEKESLEPFENELEKTEKTKEIIEFINSCLAEEFDKLGLKYTAMLYEKIHLFSEEVFVKTFPDEPGTVGGFNSSVGSEAYIKFTNDKAKTFKIIFHEMVHLASHSVYYGDVKEDKLRNYRTGYMSTNWQKNAHQHFRGFNEGVIDLLVSEIVNKKFDNICSLLKISNEDWKNVEWYWDESELLNFIMEKISETKREKWEDIYRRFKKGLFTGDMMHLRDIEKTFGKDSLKILGDWQPTNADADAVDVDTYKKIYMFFKADNETEREKLKQELL